MTVDLCFAARVRKLNLFHGVLDPAVAGPGPTMSSNHPITYAGTALVAELWVSRYPISAISGAFWKDRIIEPH